MILQSVVSFIAMIPHMRFAGTSSSYLLAQYADEHLYYTGPHIDILISPALNFNSAHVETAIISDYSNMTAPCLSSSSDTSHLNTCMVPDTISQNYQTLNSNQPSPLETGAHTSLSDAMPNDDVECYLEDLFATGNPRNDYSDVQNLEERASHTLHRITDHGQPQSSSSIINSREMGHHIRCKRKIQTSVSPNTKNLAGPLQYSALENHLNPPFYFLGRKMG